MNTQHLLLCVISGLYVSQIWHSLLTSPSLWRKRKGLDEEQRARLYFFRAMAIIVSLIMAYLLGTLLEGATDEHWPMTTRFSLQGWALSHAFLAPGCS